MKVHTKPYGEIEVEERQQVSFPRGLFGFERIKQIVRRVNAFILGFPIGGFGPELIAVALDCLRVNGAAADRKESATTSLIFQVVVGVRAADKH